MDDEFIEPTICLPKSIQLSSAQLFQAINNEDGVILDVPVNKHDSHDDNFDDDDDDDDNNQDDFVNAYDIAALNKNRQVIEKKTASEMTRKEFISVMLNPNGDPVLPDDCRAGESAENREKWSKLMDNKEREYIKLHRTYQNVSISSLLNITESADTEKTDSHSNAGLQNNSLLDGKQFTKIATSVYKRRLRPGVGKNVTENSYVIFNAAFWTDGAAEPYDSTWLRRKAFIMNLAEDPILPGLAFILVSMKQDEFSEAIIDDPNLAFGPLGCPPRVPGNSKLFCIIEMIKVVDTDKVPMITEQMPHKAQASGISFEQFYSAANAARQRGNFYLTRKMYKVAIDRYKTGIRILLGITYNSELEDKKAKELLLKLYNNTSKTFNALGRPRMVLSFCKLAEDIDPSDPKMHWNYVKAWSKKGHYDLALNRCRKAIQEIENKDHRVLFEKEARILKAKLKMEEEDEKNFYRLMGKAAVGDMVTVADDAA